MSGVARDKSTFVLEFEWLAVAKCGLKLGEVLHDLLLHGLSYVNYYIDLQVCVSIYLHSTISVSYTHLDVYKRQRFFFNVFHFL